MVLARIVSIGISEPLTLCHVRYSCSVQCLRAFYTGQVKPYGYLQGREHQDNTEEENLTIGEWMKCVDGHYSPLWFSFGVVCHQECPTCLGCDGTQGRASVSCVL